MGLLGMPPQIVKIPDLSAIENYKTNSNVKCPITNVKWWMVPSKNFADRHSILSTKEVSQGCDPEIIL
jgi:hypothetical protein